MGNVPSKSIIMRPNDSRDSAGDAITGFKFSICLITDSAVSVYEKKDICEWSRSDICADNLQARSLSL